MELRDIKECSLGIRWVKIITLYLRTRIAIRIQICSAKVATAINFRVNRLLFRVFSKPHMKISRNFLTTQTSKTSSTKPNRISRFPTSNGQRSSMQLQISGFSTNTTQIRSMVFSSIFGQKSSFHSQRGRLLSWRTLYCFSKKCFKMLNNQSYMGILLRE